MTNKLFYQYGDFDMGQPAGNFAFCPMCGVRLIRRDVGGRLRPACPECGFVQFVAPAVAVSVLVVSDGRVLLGRRLAEPGRGGWSPPSGYIEFDDDLVGAAIREVQEETGLIVEITSILNVIVSFLSSDQHFLTVYVEGHPTGGVLCAADDLDEAAWFRLDGPLPEMPFQEDVDMISLLATRQWTGIPVSASRPMPVALGRDSTPAGTTFVTLVSDTSQLAGARLLIESLRRFGGEMQGCPIWLFEADPDGAPCADLAVEGVEIFRLELPESVRGSWYATKVYACACAEQMAGPEVSTLVWMAPDCLVVQPPVLFDLGAGYDAAVRPVHHKNVGLSIDEPLDPFWRGVYQAVGVEDLTSEIESFVEGERLRPYYNSHLIAVCPERGLFRRWFHLFEALASDAAFQRTACQDDRHRIFLHQAVLSALLAKTVSPQRLRLLPPEYSYPYHLHTQVPAERRAKALNELVCVAYEELSLHPDKVTDIALNEPLRSWLAPRV